MPDDVPTADHQEGDAAAAIRSAEIALAHQNSTTAQVDLQVVAAVLNAHQKATAGRDALSVLQRDIEGAVATRSDLDTPAGARDFQRYLIGKLRDIQAVVAAASLDDTSNSALLAAWTSLYNSSQPGADASESSAKSPAASTSAPESSAPAAQSGLEPYLDSLPDDDSATASEPAPAPSAPSSPTVPSIPSFGGAGLPSGGGFGMPGGFPLSGAFPQQPTPDDVDDAGSDSDEPEYRSASEDEQHEPKPEEPASGPTTVTLPTGETVTASSPQLAAVIEAAAGGTPIAEAFRQEGMTIPPPGTAVDDPVDPSQLGPGDIGMFVDRHALALGESRALVNGQIQHLSTVSGPGFLGWEHPPTPAAPAAPTSPAPTRPAVAETTEPA